MKRLLLLFALFIAYPLAAAIVAGTCKDDGGNVLPGVTVTLAGSGGGVAAVVTNAQGQYRFTNVTAGHYTIKWELAGYGFASAAIDVPADHIVIADGVLKASVSEAITVTAASVVDMRGAGYRPIKEHDFEPASKAPTTTFSIDVDKASYANVRRFLHDGAAPPPDAVRVEEMINYFTYHYPQPDDGRPFAVTTEVTGCPWNAAHRLMRIGIQGKSTEAWKLAPNNLVFLLDVSGSMDEPNRLPLIKDALRLLVANLRGEDSVAIVVYAGAAGLVLPPTSGAEKEKILAALDNLQAGGSTAGEEGIRLAYQVAKQAFLTKGNNRVILATDGDFNVGVSRFEDLTKLIEKQRDRNIYLTCLGVGDDNLQDSAIEMLADKGNGNYFYLDSIDEAKKVFQRELAGTLVTVADDVKVQLTFDPAAVKSYRQIGYENRELNNEDFADDTKDAGELGSGHSVTVLYELEPLRPSGTIATLKLRYKEPGAWRSKELATTIRDEGKGVFDATPDTQFAAAVAEFGMLLRDSAHKGSASWADVAALARAMRGEDLEGYREELLHMVESGQRLSASASAQK